MGERIAKIRKDLGFNQEEFATRLRVSRNYIAQLEMKNPKRTPSDKLITAICQTFNVNEEWLRTGNGDVYKLSTHDFSSVCAEIGTTDKRLQKAIIELWKMPMADRELLWKYLENLVNAISEENEQG